VAGTGQGASGAVLRNERGEFLAASAQAYLRISELQMY
jgi:hypothetical protein